MSTPARRDACYRASIDDASLHTLRGGELIARARDRARGLLSSDEDLLSRSGDPGGGWNDVTRGASLENLLPSEYARDSWEFMIRHLERAQLSLRRERVQSRRSAPLPILVLGADLLGRARRFAIGAALALLGDARREPRAPRIALAGRAEPADVVSVETIDDVARLLDSPPALLTADAARDLASIARVSETPFFVGSARVVETVDLDDFAGSFLITHDSITWQTADGTSTARLVT